MYIYICNRHQYHLVPLCLFVRSSSQVHGDFSFPGVKTNQKAGLCFCSICYILTI